MAGFLLASVEMPMIMMTMWMMLASYYHSIIIVIIYEYED